MFRRTVSSTLFGLFPYGTGAVAKAAWKGQISWPDMIRGACTFGLQAYLTGRGLYGSVESSGAMEMAMVVVGMAAFWDGLQEHALYEDYSMMGVRGVTNLINSLPD
jgi:hypothetical protein